MLTLSSKCANGFCEPSLPASATQSIAGSLSCLFSVQVTSSHQPRILKSAFRIPSIPTSQWSREVSLTHYRFTEIVEWSQRCIDGGGGDGTQAQGGFFGGLGKYFVM